MYHKLVVQTDVFVGETQLFQTETDFLFCPGLSLALDGFPGLTDQRPGVLFSVDLAEHSFADFPIGTLCGKTAGHDKPAFRMTLVARSDKRAYIALLAQRTVLYKTVQNRVNEIRLIALGPKFCEKFLPVVLADPEIDQSLALALDKKRGATLF